MYGGRFGILGIEGPTNPGRQNFCKIPGNTQPKGFEKDYVNNVL